MSKYKSISEEIKRRIQEDEYTQEGPIPDELTLALEFECSRMTMKRALDLLVDEGLLFRKRGHGTFIIKSAIQANRVNVVDTQNIGLTKLIGSQELTSDVIQFHVKFPTKVIQEHLAIESNSPIYDIIRVRYVDGSPYVIEHTFMPVHIIPRLTEKVLKLSVYGFISNELGLCIGGAHKKIRADKPNKQDEQYLHCTSDDPIIEVEQVAYLDTGIPFEYSFSRHRYDRFEFNLVTIRK
ncbi:GntR family transcriptional regulator [Lysinibacillus piscis]|uniref:GntR family transcriptional regulator n=1 Tax=Lysinibacillus piscis TaxID=2518931 RepID=UPI00222F2B33|nr:GntR family transcriptional regulator [Lysinibacillus sp. KH24]